MSTRLQLGDVINDRSESLQRRQAGCLINNNLGAKLHNDTGGRGHQKNSLKTPVESGKWRVVCLGVPMSKIRIDRCWICAVP